MREKKNIVSLWKHYRSSWVFFFSKGKERMLLVTCMVKSEGVMFSLAANLKNYKSKNLTGQSKF